MFKLLILLYKTKFNEKLTTAIIAKAIRLKYFFILDLILKLLQYFFSPMSGGRQKENVD